MAAHLQNDSRRLESYQSPSLELLPSAILGVWLFPGINPGQSRLETYGLDSPSVCAVRETFEEVGLRILLSKSQMRSAGRVLRPATSATSSSTCTGASATGINRYDQIKQRSPSTAGSILRMQHASCTLARRNACGISCRGISYFE